MHDDSATSPRLPTVSPAEREAFAALAAASHGIITKHQHAGGAYPASPTFSAYRGYAWLRDGAFTAEGISRFGDVTSASRFHGWVAGVLADRRSQVDRLLDTAANGVTPAVADMLPTRFTFEGADGSDPWWDFQTDGYGSWLWSVVTHAHRHQLDLERWRPAVEVAVDYTTAFWSMPCYDWWEEHVEHRHTSTLAAIHGGLAAVLAANVLDAARTDAASTVLKAMGELVRTEAVAGGHLTKWVGTTEIDGSLPAAIVPFGLIAADDPVAVRTVEAVARELDADGGVHRFTADVFYGGGQWPLLSALLGWNLAARGDTDGAIRHLRWIAGHATAEGEMPEQVPEHLLHPGARQEWIDRWGPVATPLLWSHGMYLILADELGLISTADQP